MPAPCWPCWPAAAAAPTPGPAARWKHTCHQPGWRDSAGVGGAGGRQLAGIARRTTIISGLGAGASAACCGASSATAGAAPCCCCCCWALAALAPFLPFLAALAALPAWRLAPLLPPSLPDGSLSES